MNKITTIKELKKKYSYNNYDWIAFRADKNMFPSWDFNDDDIVIYYEVKEKKKQVDITCVVFGKDKVKVTYKTELYVIWKRKEK